MVKAEMNHFSLLILIVTLAVTLLLVALESVSASTAGGGGGVGGGLEAPPEQSINTVGTGGTGRTFDGAIVSDFDIATIFVAVAAFRDKRCHQTMSHMFKTARNPHRVFAGIIEQNEHGDQICPPMPFFDCRSHEFCPLDNLRRRRIASRYGKGPCYGRHVSSLLYRGESYYMMIDSHCQFTHQWDWHAIMQLHRARSSRPVISHYPAGWDNNGWQFESTGNSIYMCNGHYVSMHFVRMDGRWMNRNIEPRIQPFTAAGFLFATSDPWHQVPFDPHLDYLFDGEEILYSVRLWTAGFDLFGATSVLFHDYNRHRHLGFYRHWDVQNEIPNNSHWHGLVTISQQRAQLMMEIPKENSTVLLVDRHAKNLHPRILRDFDRYTIGKRRPMEEYNWFAKLDASRRKANDAFCKWLEHETIVKSAK